MTMVTKVLAAVAASALMIAFLPSGDAFAQKKTRASASVREQCIAKVRAMYPQDPQAAGAGPMASDKRESLVRDCIRSGGRVPGT